MKRNNKETRSYVQGLRLFSKLLPKNTKNILRKNGHNYLEIIKRWNDLKKRTDFLKQLRVGPGGLGDIDYGNEDWLLSDYIFYGRPKQTGTVRP